MEYTTFTGKTVDDAINKAIVELRISSDLLDFEVEDKGAAGILGIGARPAVIRARVKDSVDGNAEAFLQDVFRSMNMDVTVVSEYNEDEHTLNIDLQGDDMGILIGKRGQTLDSLQYLTSLVVNKKTEEYVRVKLDIENYRERREEPGLRVAPHGGEAFVHHPEAEVQQVRRQLAGGRVRQVVRDERRDDEPVQRVVPDDREGLPADRDFARSVAELEGNPQARRERAQGVFAGPGHYAFTSCPGLRRNVLGSILP